MKIFSSFRWIVGLSGALSCLTTSAGPLPDAPRIACAVDEETLNLLPCALETRHGATYVVARYLPKLFGGERGPLVARILPGSGWSYIDRSGKVVVRHVAIMDNYASEFHYGLVRVNRDGKWGLADEEGRLVVPPSYDGILDYQPGLGWRACTGCCSKTGGEHSWFEGGDWITLDRRGRKIR